VPRRAVNVIGWCLLHASGSSLQRDELLNGASFTTLLEVKVLIENRRRNTNTVRPHNSLGYQGAGLEEVISNKGYLIE